MGRMLATTTFSYGQRGERADLPERLLLELLSYNDPRFLSRLFLLFSDIIEESQEGGRGETPASTALRK